MVDKIIVSLSAVTEHRIGQANIALYNTGTWLMELTVEKIDRVKKSE